MAHGLVRYYANPHMWKKSPSFFRSGILGFPFAIFCFPRQCSQYQVVWRGSVFLPANSPQPEYFLVHRTCLFIFKSKAQWRIWPRCVEPPPRCEKSRYREVLVFGLKIRRKLSENSKNTQTKALHAFYLKTIVHLVIVSRETFTSF